MVTDLDIARWRLHTQRLTAPAPDAGTVVGGLLAVQAENRQQAGWAVACRTVSPRAAELDALLAEGAVVRTHVLRPTWHFVAADDVGWLLELTAPRVRPVLLRQLTDLPGWGPGELDRAATTVCEVLAANPDQDRGQLAEALAAHGVSASGQALMLLLGLLELDRLVCSGRERDGTHTYALFSERVGERRRLDRDEALAELAWRYVAGHGPVTERDLAYWATLTLTDVRRGLELSRDRLETFTHDGRTFWHTPGTAPPGPGRPTGHLLQLLDETYRGYQDSRMVLDAAGVVPRGREAAIGMALVDAQLVGGMRRTVGARVRFDVAPYRRLAAAEEAALEEAAGRYGAFLGREHELRIHR
ncbi:Winged helix DNA-binding domain-containing protein [Georgenia satyanarayanai]|uniref:Winged helix DNA-binding domain-containing protein n=1 Tax=Georgenia satyanarayanai TaxID=860221 RepID=A0A2Y9BY01_9MICO|nr:winged helix DNA-binding domain-containing protein [Georgenia satyanarayanai]PYF99782.1 winged helix DNA-binding protein [Georgenia satyanarayanai]SSA41762.1 Winged helix DNA-binding domain-containing protein [Georgenia satyanarayanai]